MFNTPPRRRALRWSLGLFAAAVATLARAALHPMAGEQVPWLFQLGAVMMVTWMGGADAGVVAVLASGALGRYFLSPADSGATSSEQVAAVALFTVVGLAIVWQVSRWARVEQALRQKEATLEDVSARLQQQLVELEAIYESAPVGLCVLDSQFRWVRMNRLLAEINGLPVEAHIGKTPSELLPDIGEQPKAAFAEIMRTGKPLPDFEISGTTPAQPGVLRSWNERWAPVKDAQGRVVGVAVAAEEITERKRAEQALRESEERLRLAMAAADAGAFVFEIDSEVLQLTPDAARVYGLPEDTGSLSKAAALALVEPDDRSQLEAALRAATDTGDYHVEYRVPASDGGVRSLVSFAKYQAADRRLVGIVMNVTQLRRSEEALRQYELRYRALFDAIDEGFCIIEVLFDEHDKPVDYRFLETNPAFEKQTGLVGAVGKRMRELVPGHEQHWFDIYGAIALTGQPARFENPAAGLHRFYDVYAFRFGRPEDRHVAVLFHDISERKRVEADLHDADRRKDEFLAILSHELRNPLAPIRYALPLLQRERLEETGLRAVAVINRQVDHLTRLVDDLLDVSRITQGKINLRREHVTLGAVVTAAAEAVAPVIVAARHTLKLEVEEEPIWVYADQARLAQVTTNLLANSAKYTPPGGEIVLEGHRDKGHAIIRVRDNGIGVPPDALPTLFEMFRQVSRPETPQGGLGIGLALVKSLVEMHDGTVEAHSTGVGRGAEFVVRLPLAQEPAGATLSGRIRTANGRAPLKVLIVDDNVDLVEMLGAVVSSLGHDVRKALDGRSALSAAKSYIPDVVLLDLGLPAMSGLDVARELRRQPETANARLIALTGWGQEQDRLETRDAGFDHHLTKPTDPEILEDLLIEIAADLQSAD